MYRMRNYSIHRLIKLGFYWNGAYSSKGENYYTYRFTVYQYQAAIVLQCEIKVLAETGQIWVDVYTNGTRERYASYYCDRDSSSTMMRTINANIKQELKRLQIYEEKENGNYQNKVFQRPERRTDRSA